MQFLVFYRDQAYDAVRINFSLFALNYSFLNTSMV